VHPNNIILGIAGDFDSAAMEAKLRAAFESLPKGRQSNPRRSTLKLRQPGVYFAEKEDVNQSEIQLITLGIRRDNPDYYALNVMNDSLGTGSPRDCSTVSRSRQGLAYSVGGGIPRIV